MVIGEFHFGALDRGMFHTGLVATASQADRADAYRRYVRSALGIRQIVGTHWFEFGDEAVTGRGDGENYQIGFVDVCDTPYAETIAASREIGRQLYELRCKPGERSRLTQPRSPDFEYIQCTGPDRVKLQQALPNYSIVHGFTCLFFARCFFWQGPRS